jgi:diguanylate cyclase (GGDEF)-like protein
MKLLRNQLAIRRLRDVSLIFFDIDHFKQINDRFGHQAGDAVLAETGKVIRETIRRYDVAGRFGGDEFLIALPETGSENALIVAEKLRGRLKERVVDFREAHIRFTASLGVSSLLENEKRICQELEIGDLKSFFEITPSSNEGWEAADIKKLKIPDVLVLLADRALYAAKTTSCRGCSFHSEHAESFAEGRCPKCGSTDLEQGRDRTIVFQESDGGGTRGDTA